MTDKPSSPFTGLDKALLRSTKQPASPAEGRREQTEERVEEAEIPLNKNAEKQEIQQTSKQENQHAGKLETKKTSTPEDQHAGNRGLYPKVTYRLSPAAIEAIEDAKRMLRRQYNIKVSLEEIAEEAIQAAYADLLENKQSSLLVSKFTGKPVNKKPSK